MPPSIITGKKWCLADPGGTSLYCIIASDDHPCLIMPSSNSTHFFRVFRCIGWAELLKFGFILCDLFLNSAYIVITQHRPFEVCNASVTYLHENINDESEI